MLVILWFKCVQFSICVPFAITTNKAQRQSFGEFLAVNLRGNCISYGQLYMALLRATNASSIVVDIGREDRKTEKVVYHEVLSTNYIALRCKGNINPGVQRC